MQTVAAADYLFAAAGISDKSLNCSGLAAPQAASRRRSAAAEGRVRRFH
jgi:hypothetical protein